MFSNPTLLRTGARTPFLTSSVALALALTFASTVRLSAAAPSDPLTLLPANSAAIGHITLRDLKDSPLTREVFKGLDQITTDGDAAKFLSDAGLNTLYDQIYEDVSRFAATEEFRDDIAFVVTRFH